MLRQSPLMTACTALLLVALVGCTETASDRPGDDGGGGSDLAQPGPDGAAGQPKIVDDSHAGYQKANCDDCHILPEKNHTADKPWLCAQCHGGNGACNPNGAFSKNKNHDKTADCISCHVKQHTFTTASNCVSCHFADKGTADCEPGPKLDGGVAQDSGGGKQDSGGGKQDAGSTGPPVLSKNLQHNCLNWPATPFSTSNLTSWQTSLSAGQLAVDFTLKDTAGKSYTLSQLLATKPVWLQLGSYT